MCVLGKRLLRNISVTECGKNYTTTHDLFCNGTSGVCDAYYNDHEFEIVKGIKGLASGVFLGTY